MHTLEGCYERGGSWLLDHMCWTTSGEVRRERTSSGQVRGNMYILGPWLSIGVVYLE